MTDRMQFYQSLGAHAPAKATYCSCGGPCAGAAVAHGTARRCGCSEPPEKTACEACRCRGVTTRRLLRDRAATAVFDAGAALRRARACRTRSRPLPRADVRRGRVA
eukprot:scaffold1500_cov398-Prasinococcus_capsulatus_cf.AAC.17